MANYYIHGQQLQIVDNAKYLGHLQKSLVEQSRKQHHEEGKFHPSIPSTLHPKLPTES
jgi:hypothetical protein